MRLNKKKDISRLSGKDFNTFISELYLEDKLCTEEIVAKIFKLTGIIITTRYIQTQLKKLGISRTKEESFQLAIKNGRKNYDKLRKTVKSRELRKGINLKLRYLIFKRDNYRCVICGNNAQGTVLMVDHIIPVVQGGHNEENNLRTLCRECNLGKMIAEHEK
ncbi:MAG: HNH endonuclease signature motif containing protein [Candidatus Buchananbacteria bacterium]|jgi:hypothetical protein